MTNHLALSALHVVSVAVAESGAHGVACPRCQGRALVTEPSDGVFALRQFHKAGCALAAELHQVVSRGS